MTNSAHRIHADLQNKGVRCWFAPHDLPIGDKILDTLEESSRFGLVALAVTLIFLWAALT
jgi:hypothetical protein